MDLGLTEQQLQIQKMAREFAESRLAPIAAEIDENERFPDETVAEMGKLGLLGMMTPKEYGGQGLDAMSYVLAVEEISRVCASHGVTMSVHNSLASYPLIKFGTDEQKQKYLSQLGPGTVLGSFALTEGNAGTDAASQQTTAEDRGDHYLLNGAKIFITNGSKSDIIITFAMTDKSAGVKGITAFIIESGYEGYKIGAVEKKMGIRGSIQTELIYENMKVPKENVLGGVGAGFKVAMATLDGGRIGIAAQALGIAQAAYEASVKYAKERTRSGKPIGKQQAVQWIIADMATQIDAARLLVYKAGYAKDTQPRFSTEAAMAKLYASDVAVRVTRDAVQMHGGHGYTKELPVERFFRDAKITEIYEGTSEVQKMVIAGDKLR